MSLSLSVSWYRSPHYVPRCRVHGGRTCVSLRRAFYVGVHRTVSDIEREKDNGIRGPRQRERDETLSKPRTLSWIEEEGLFPWKILWKTFRSASSLRECIILFFLSFCRFVLKRIFFVEFGERETFVRTFLISFKEKKRKMWTIMYAEVEILRGILS